MIWPPVVLLLLIMMGVLVARMAADMCEKISAMEDVYDKLLKQQEEAYGQVPDQSESQVTADAIVPLGH